MARPTLLINWEAFDRLCEIQCTQTEIAHVLCVSVDTIEKAIKREKKISYTEYYAQKRKLGFVSLRRKAFDRAETSDALLIFLLKNYLGMTDRQQVEHSGSVTYEERISKWLKDRDAELDGVKPIHASSNGDK